MQDSGDKEKHGKEMGEYSHGFETRKRRADTITESNFG
jgi:hypothetical protein